MTELKGQQMWMLTMAPLSGHKVSSTRTVQNRSGERLTGERVRFCLQVWRWGCHISQSCCPVKGAGDLRLDIDCFSQMLGLHLTVALSQALRCLPQPADAYKKIQCAFHA